MFSKAKYICVKFVTVLLSSILLMLSVNGAAYGEELENTGTITNEESDSKAANTVGSDYPEKDKSTRESSAETSNPSSSPANADSDTAVSRQEATNQLPVLSRPQILVSHVLWRGEWSNEVRTMQLGLAHYYPECVDFAPDGGFGGKTEAAVKCVQRKFGVYADGGFGYYTTVKLRQAGITAAIVGKINTKFNLVPGQTNSDYVRNLQTWMMIKYPNECGITWPDKTFGAGTAKCVRNIREKLGLPESEIADRAFADAIREDSSTDIVIKDAPEPSPNHWTSATMWSGSRVASVLVLQQGLNKYFPQYAGFWADGVYGGKTTAAVKSFQRAHGITPDGGVGMKTAKALRAKGIPVWVIPSTNFISVMGNGSWNHKVEVVQTALTHLYPSYCNFTPDGGYGKLTEQCVKNFQRANGIYPDGKVGMQGIKALRSKGMYFNYLGSGDATLDAKLESIVARYGSLSSAYSYVVNNYRYIGAHGKSHPSGSNWDIRYAKEFFANGGGNCYSFAAGYKWIAKALGYSQATIRLGYVANARAPHGWNEIKIGGTTYIFDTDEDMAYKRSKGGWAFYYKTYWNAPIYYWDANKRALN